MATASQLQASAGPVNIYFRWNDQNLNILDVFVENPSDKPCWVGVTIEGNFAEAIIPAGFNDKINVPQGLGLKMGPLGRNGVYRTWNGDISMRWPA